MLRNTQTSEGQGPPTSTTRHESEITTARLNFKSPFNPNTVYLRSHGCYSRGVPRAGWVKPDSDQRLSEHISLGGVDEGFSTRGGGRGVDRVWAHGTAPSAVAPELGHFA